MHLHHVICGYSASYKVITGHSAFVNIQDYKIRDKDEKKEKRSSGSKGAKATRSTEAFPVQTRAQSAPPRQQTPSKGRGPQKKPSAPSGPTKTSQPTKKKTTFKTSATGSSSQNVCCFCKGRHAAEHCNDDTIPPETKYDLAFKAELCLQCLRPGHQLMQCRAKLCGKNGCVNKHHEKIHTDKRMLKPKTRS